MSATNKSLFDKGNNLHLAPEYRAKYEAARAAYERAPKSEKRQAFWVMKRALTELQALNMRTDYRALG